MGGGGRVFYDAGVPGGLDGGHNEGGLLNHAEEPALDDIGFSISSASQAGKHDGPDRLPRAGSLFSHLFENPSISDSAQVLNSTWLNAKYSEVEVSDDYLMNIVAFQSHQRKEGMKVFTRWARGWQSEIDDRSIPGRISEARGLRCPTAEVLSPSTPSTAQTATP